MSVCVIAQALNDRHFLKQALTENGYLTVDDFAGTSARDLAAGKQEPTETC